MPGNEKKKIIIIIIIKLIITKTKILESDWLVPSCD